MKVKYLIFAKGTFFNDAGWPYEEKFFNQVFNSREEAEEVIRIMHNQKYDTPGYNQEYEDFFDYSMDKAEFEVYEINTDQRSEGGVFFERKEEQ